MIERPHYLKAIEPFIGQDVIKVLTGMRRSGKSTILNAVKQQLELWRAAVGAREEVYPTGLATASCGIALPHADAEHIIRPFIALVRPASPIPRTP